MAQGSISVKPAHRRHAADGAEATNTARGEEADVQVVVIASDRHQMANGSILPGWF
jgi:hypothetical protein